MSDKTGPIARRGLRHLDLCEQRLELRLKVQELEYVLAERDAQLAACREREKALREALEWYANLNVYDISTGTHVGVISKGQFMHWDNGDRARRALAGEGKETP